jgi:hypothetical protein
MRIDSLPLKNIKGMTQARIKKNKICISRAKKLTSPPYFSPIFSSTLSLIPDPKVNIQTVPSAI